MGSALFLSVLTTHRVEVNNRSIYITLYILLTTMCAGGC